MMPFLVIGATFGRLHANLCLNAVRYLDPAAPLTFEPYVFAVSGAGAMLVGSGRITLTMCVILLETANDVTLLPPLAIATLTAQTVGNFFNRGLYHMLMEVQGVPFLHDDATVLQSATKVSSLLRAPPVCLKSRSTTGELKALLASSSGHNHNGFPVIGPSGEYVGMVYRMQLIGLMQSHVPRGSAQSSTLSAAGDATVAAWDSPMGTRSDTDNSDTCLTLPLLEDETDPDAHDLSRVADPVVGIPPDSTVAEAFNMFRKMGLRHLPVCDKCSGAVVGVLTRKDLLPWRCTRSAQKEFPC